MLSFVFLLLPIFKLRVMPLRNKLLDFFLESALGGRSEESEELPSSAGDAPVFLLRIEADFGLSKAGSLADIS